MATVGKLGEIGKMDRRTFMQGIAAAGLGLVNPPYVKRGWKSQKAAWGAENGHQRESDCVGLHWLRGRVAHGKVAAVRDYCCLFFGDDVEARSFGLWRYDRSLELRHSVSINYQSTKDRADSITGGYAVLEVPGGALETLAPELLGSFVKGLASFGFECTRADVYFDDFTPRPERMSPGELHRRVYEVDLLGDEFRREFTGFLECSVSQNAGGKRKGKLTGRGLTYSAVSWGRRGSLGSGKYLRYYDKWLESGGERDCGRWELELCKKRAQKLYRAFVQVPANGWPHLIGLAIGGCIDFRHRPVNGAGQLLRAGDKNWERCKRMWFWTRILAKLGGRLPMSDPIQRMTVERSSAWVKDQCSGVLQLLGRAYGVNELLCDLLDIIGQSDRMAKKHRDALVDYLQRRDGKKVPTVTAVRHWADRHGVRLESEPGEPDLPSRSPTEQRRRRFVLGTGKQHLWEK
jgi:hypothetical protein